MTERTGTLGRGAWICIWVAAAAVRIAVAIPLVHDWDGFVFTESARNLLDGVTPYATVEEDPPAIYPRSDRPMVQQWYAYPALPLLAFTSTFAVARLLGVDGIQLVANFAVKVPAMAGDLVCAALLVAFLRHRGTARARGAALLVLFNPLLIWVSSAWGMFDIWMVNFALLFLLCLRRGQAGRAGLFLGLGPQVKLFPLLFLPAFAAYAFRRIPDGRGRVRVAAVFAGVTLLLVAPFLALDPRGFVTQNLLMHLQRPPQGIGIAGLLDFVALVREWELPPVIPVLGLAALVIVAVANLWAIAFARDNELRLLTGFALAFSAVLLGNKVVNEQYFVVLLVLLLILSRLAPEVPSMFGATSMRRLEVTTTVCVLASSLVLGFHFVTFVPDELARRLDASTDTLVYHLAARLPQVPLHAYPETFGTYYNLPTTLAFLLVTPVLVMLGILVARGTIAAVVDLRRLLPTRLSVRRWTAGGAVFAVAATSLVVPVALRIRSGERTTAPAETAPGGIGTFYYAWWGNSSHRPERPTDVWRKTTQTPAIGHYESKTPYYVRHIEQMKDAGIDFAVVSYHLYDRRRFHTFATHAEELGFRYAPLLEPEEVLGEAALRPQTPSGEPGVGFRADPDSAERLAAFAASVFPASGPGPGWLRIDNKPVVFVFDAHHFLPSWDGPSRAEIAQRILTQYSKQGGDPYPRISEAWGRDVRPPLDYHYPSDVHSFNNANPDTTSPANADFRRAYVDAYAALWRRVRRVVERRFGPVYLVGTHPSPVPQDADVVISANDIERAAVFDDVFAYSPAGTWAGWRLVAPPEQIFGIWRNQATDLAARAMAAGRPVFQTVMPAFDDRRLRGQLGFRIAPRLDGVATYDRTWQVALDNRADYVLVTSWNEFFEGSAIEPTVEDGHTYLDATRRWARIMRSAKG